jgi:hypothetical protein
MAGAVQGLVGRVVAERETLVRADGREPNDVARASSSIEAPQPRPKKHETTGSNDLFRARLDQIINMTRAGAARRRDRLELGWLQFPPRPRLVESAFALYPGGAPQRSRAPAGLQINFLTADYGVSAKSTYSQL